MLALGAPMQHGPYRLVHQVHVADRRGRWRHLGRVIDPRPRVPRPHVFVRRARRRQDARCVALASALDFTHPDPHQTDRCGGTGQQR